MDGNDSVIAAMRLGASGSHLCRNGATVLGHMRGEFGEQLARELLAASSRLANGVELARRKLVLVPASLERYLREPAVSWDRIGIPIALTNRKFTKESGRIANQIDGDPSCDRCSLRPRGAQGIMVCE